MHKVHIIQATYSWKKNKAALILLDLSPGRKPNVMKYLWKGGFVVSELLLLFWIPFQERLNWFSKPDLVCYSPLLLGGKTWIYCAGAEWHCLAWLLCTKSLETGAVGIFPVCICEMTYSKEHFFCHSIFLPVWKSSGVKVLGFLCHADHFLACSVW